MDILLFISKRRKTEKGGKGLRHFSMKVCEKVRKKGVTSYNEVADELVAEFTNPAHISINHPDQVCASHSLCKVYVGKEQEDVIPQCLSTLKNNVFISTKQLTNTI